jgi:hypothetical protein
MEGMSMFDDGQPAIEEKEPTDYTGLKIGAFLAPVFFLFVYLGKAEMGFTVIIVLGMTMLAVKLRWKLRKYVWFWATIVLILALHVPLFFLVHWSDSKVPTIAYSMPIGIADFLLIMAAVGLAEKFFLKGSPPKDGEE